MKWIAACLMSLQFSVAIAQDVTANMTTATYNGAAQAVDALTKRYGYVITLETPRYLNQDDLEDTPAQYRKDLGKYEPGAAPKVMVAKGINLTRVCQRKRKSRPSR